MRIFAVRFALIFRGVFYREKFDFIRQKAGRKTFFELLVFLREK